MRAGLAALCDLGEDAHSSGTCSLAALQRSHKKRFPHEEELPLSNREGSEAHSNIKAEITNGSFRRQQHVYSHTLSLAQVSHTHAT